jgi:hypothetical protein
MNRRFRGKNISGNLLALKFSCLKVPSVQAQSLHKPQQFTPFLANAHQNVHDQPMTGNDLRRFYFRK